jgi:predicted 2-oxoglutarate/Fe(II)-dependent dioxygenase YbiX
MSDVWLQRPLHGTSVADFLTAEECETIRNDALAIGLTRATMRSPYGRVKLKMRTNFHVAYPRTPDRDWLYERIFAKGQEVNQEYWRFALTDVEEVQILRYRPGQRIGWHFDTTIGVHRKIACVVTLSSPETHWGGRLELVGKHDNREVADLLGAATWFPTYLRHRATRPWWGERWSFVAWLAGPEWI